VNERERPVRRGQRGREARARGAPQEHPEVGLQRRRRVSHPQRS
jgi:hypothetical protein